jgi:hypothetical protein
MPYLPCSALLTLPVLPALPEMNPLGCTKPYSAGLVWSILGEYRVVTQGKIRIKREGGKTDRQKQLKRINEQMSQIEKTPTRLFVPNPVNEPIYFYHISGAYRLAKLPH